jgi:hypothetical protein
VLDRAWRGNGGVVAAMAADLPPDHEPPGQPMELDPRLVELCFQATGVWELGTAGRMALPSHLDRVTRFEAPQPARALWAVVTPRPDGAADAEVVDQDGRVRVRLEGYRTMALPAAEEESILAPLRAAMEAVAP